MLEWFCTMKKVELLANSKPGIQDFSTQNITEDKLVPLQEVAHRTAHKKKKKKQTENEKGS